MQKSRLLAALFCLVPALSMAATIQLAPPVQQTFITPFLWEGMEGPVNQHQEFDFSELPHVRITGPIEEGDAKQLADLMMNDVLEAMNRGEFNQPLIVSFDSEGGSYVGGLALSDMIQRMNAATYVGPGDRCLSACALAWLGGQQELMSRTLWQPTRFLHVDSTLGFHAPFNNEYPQGIGSLDQVGVELVADLFYGLARESIRELQKRINSWKIHPGFVFDFLGKGSNEFLNVDHADVLFRNNITALVEQPHALRQIGSLEALSACNYALRTMVEPAANYQSIGNTRGGGVNLSNPQELIAFSNDEKPVRIETGQGGRNQLIVEDWIPGRGPFSCYVENQGDAWAVRVEGDIPQVPTMIGYVLDFNQSPPFLVTAHNAIGVMTPWRVLRGEDLWLQRDPFTNVPVGHLRENGPSFNCNADLDKAAIIICAFHTLSRADAIMAGLYSAKRHLPGVQQGQRAWVQARNKRCRISHTDRAEEVSFRIAGYCLLAFSLARIEALAEL